MCPFLGGWVDAGTVGHEGMHRSLERIGHERLGRRRDEVEPGAHAGLVGGLLERVDLGFDAVELLDEWYRDDTELVVIVGRELVERLVVVTPTPKGQSNPLVLAAAHIAGVDEIWCISVAGRVPALYSSRIFCRSANSPGGTGAPAMSTRFTEGSVILFFRQWRLMIRQSVGEPKELVTFSWRMAWTIFAGSTSAGRCGSISGTMVVMPRAGLKRAKMGSMGRSTSPGWMP